MLSFTLSFDTISLLSWHRLRAPVLILSPFLVCIYDEIVKTCCECGTKTTVLQADACGGV